MIVDGPFNIQNVDTLGNLLDTLAPGCHYKTDPETWATWISALASYRVHPSFLQNIWAGDNPTNPTLTIPLRFPDQATASAVLISCGLITDS